MRLTASCPKPATSEVSDGSGFLEHLEPVVIVRALWRTAGGRRKGEARPTRCPFHTHHLWFAPATSFDSSGFCLCQFGTGMGATAACGGARLKRFDLGGASGAFNYRSQGQ